LSPSSVDVRILVVLNSLASFHPLWGKLIYRAGINPFVRGFPIFFPVVALWFSSENRPRRSRMLAGLLATCGAIFLSVWIQHHVATHVRPILDARLCLLNLDPEWKTGWDRLYSFPSDTASLFFGLATICFLENRLAGTVAFLWTLLVISVSRISMGLHYPSDIAGGLVLGVVCVCLFARIRPLHAFFERMLQRYESRIYIVHAALFLFLADAYGLFAGLQGIYNSARAAIVYAIAKL